MRYSKDEIDGKGNLRSGFDYDRQCWIENYLILRCGHPETMGKAGLLWIGEKFYKFPSQFIKEGDEVWRTA